MQASALPSGRWGARRISQCPVSRVKAPTPHLGASAPRARNGAGLARPSVRAALLAAAVSLLAGRADARPAETPLSGWLAAIGDSAQALAEGRVDAAEDAARRALEARPRGAAGARASAALGLALAARGSPGPAAAALELALAPATAPARAHLAHARAEALLAAGDPSQAARLFGQAGRAADLALARRARLREAQALLSTGLAADALPVLEALLQREPDGPVAPAARLALARARRAVGDLGRAVATFRALWLEADLPESQAAGEALASWRSSGGPVPAPTPEDHLVRADRLLASGRPEAARDELGAAARADGPPPAPGRLEAYQAVTELALGRYAEAARAAEPLADAPDEAIRRPARWVLARVAARAGRVEEATRRYAEVAALRGPVPGLPDWRQRDLGDECAYLAAWLFYDAGDFGRATPALEAFAQANPRSRRAEDALWFAAWSRYRQGRLGEARNALARLARGPLGDAAAYWLGRLERSPARQKAFYKVAVTRAGDGWYGLLARARLATLGDPAPRPAAAPARPLPDVADPAASVRLSVAVELLGLGLADAALDELRDLVRGGPVRTSAALVAQLAAYAGDPELPFRIARDHLGQTRRTARWSHPEPYPALLPTRARAFGVDPTLLLAIMRRESAFRREVRSGAGAEGLLQLRPATAERLAALLGMAPGAGGRLAEPEVAVALGAHYLGLLTARFGDPAVALAAYNAGPAPAAEWAAARAGMPLDAWVECIPYRETRQYVKVVLADWDVYRALAGEPAAPVNPGKPVAAPKAGVSF